MQAQAASNNSPPPEPANFPAPGALTPVIMATLLEMVSRCQNIARQAEEQGNLKIALAAIKETHKLLMDLAKLDAARLKAQAPQADAQLAAPGGSVTPAQKQDNHGEPRPASPAGVSGPEPGEPKPVPPQPLRPGWPPNARGITNLGNFVY